MTRSWIRLGVEFRKSVAIRLVPFLGTAIVCIIFAGCSTSAGTASAQTAAAAQAESPPGDLGKQPNYRQVVVVAQDRNNRPLPNFSAPRDLRLYQRDKQIKIAFLQPQPVAVGIVVDTSGSMDRKLPHCRTALGAFILDLSASDEISLFAFSERPFLLEGWTTTHTAVIQRLGILHAYGRTALYDSLADMLVYMSKSSAKRGAIVLITDGMDDASTTPLEYLVDKAQKMNVPIYSIGIGNPTVRTSSLFGSTVGDVEALDTKPLKTLADASGGETFVASPDEQNRAMEKALTTIAYKIDDRYLVGFIGDGSANQLRIEAPDHKNVVFKIEPPK